MAKNYIEETVTVKVDVDTSEAKKTLAELQEKFQSLFGTVNVGQAFDKSFQQSLFSLVKLGGVADNVIKKFVELSEAQQELNTNFNYETLQKFSALYGEVTLELNKASAQLRAQGKLLETEKETLTRLAQTQQKAVQILERKFNLLTSINAEEIQSEVLRNRLLTEQKNILDHITKVKTLPTLSGDISKDIATLKEFEERIKNISHLTSMDSIKELIGAIKRELKKTKEESDKLGKALLSNIKELDANARMLAIDRQATLTALAKQKQEYDKLNIAQLSYYKQSLAASKFIKEETAKLSGIDVKLLNPEQIQVVDAAKRKLQELNKAIEGVWKYDDTKPTLLTAEIKAQQGQISKLTAEYRTQLQPAIKEITKSFATLEQTSKTSNTALQKAIEIAKITSLKIDATITDKSLLKNKYGKYADKEYNIGGDNISVVKQSDAVIAAQTALKNALSSTTVSMDEIKAATARANTELAKFSAVSKNAAVDAKPLSGSVEWVKGMAKRAAEYVAVYGGIFAAISAAKQAITVTVELDKSLHTLAAVLDINLPKARQLQEELLNLGKTIGGTSQDIDKAALLLARAGVAPEKLVESTENIIRMAAITGDTLDASAAAMISYTQTFGNASVVGEKFVQSQQEITRVLGYLSKETRASASDINTMGNYLLSAATSAGATLEATIALQATLVEAGKGFSTAGTTARRFFELLRSGSTESDKLFKALNINQQAVITEMLKGGKASEEAMTAVIKALGKLTDEQMTEMLKSFDTLDADTIQTLRNQADNYVKHLEEIKKYTYQQFIDSSDTALASLANTWDKFLNTIKSTIYTSFEPLIPVVTDILKQVMSIVNSLQASGVFDTIVLAIKGVIGAINLLLSIIEKFSTEFGVLISGFILFKTATIAGNLALTAFQTTLTMLSRVGTAVTASMSAMATTLQGISGVAASAGAQLASVAASAAAVGTIGSRLVGILGLLSRAIPYVGLAAAVGGIIYQLQTLSKEAKLTKEEISKLSSEDAVNVMVTAGRKDSSGRKADIEAETRARARIVAEAEEYTKSNTLEGYRIAIAKLANAQALYNEKLTKQTGKKSNIPVFQSEIDALINKLNQLQQAEDKAAAAAKKVNLFGYKNFNGKDKIGGGRGGESEESFDAYFRKQIADFTKGSSDLLAAYANYDAQLAEIKNKYYKDGHPKNKAHQDQFNILNNLAKLKLDLDIEAARRKFTDAMNDIDIAMQVAAGTMSTFDAELKKIDADLDTKLANLITRLNQANNIQDTKERERTIEAIKEQITQETLLSNKHKEQILQKKALNDQQLALNQTLKALDLQKIIDQTDIYIKSLYGEQEAVRKLNEEYDNRAKELTVKMKAYGTESEEYKKLKIELDNLEIERAIKLKQIQAEYSYAAMTINALFDNINNSFEQGLFDALTGSFTSFKQWSKKFFKNLWNDIAKGLSKSLADNLTSDLKTLVFGGGSSSGVAGGVSGGFSLADFKKGISVLSAVPISLTPENMTNLVENYGFTSSGTGELIGTINGQTVIIDEASKTIKQGSDVISQALGLVNAASTVKTAYGIFTEGLAAQIAKPFTTIADALYHKGIISAETASGVGRFGSNFGGGLTFNPSAVGTTGGKIGGSLTGGVLGYGVGRGLDALFGAKTYAPVTGAIAGAALGYTAMTAGLSAIPGTGWLAAAALTALGGLFGKKKKKDTGFYFKNVIDDSSIITTDTLDGSVQTYTKWQKKSWFRNKKWTDYAPVTAGQMSSIRSIFTLYDSLLSQLGVNKKIFIAEGKYSKNTFADELAKNFISLYTDIPRYIEKTLPDFKSVGKKIGKLLNDKLAEIPEAITDTVIENNPTFDAIYQTWVDYAKSIDKTVAEAFSETVGQLISIKRSFIEWKLGFEGKELELLQYKAQNAQKDFEMLAESIGASGVTIENFIERMEEAVKTSFTPETIKSWEALGKALQAATEAQRAYANALAKDSTEATTAAGAAAVEAARKQREYEEALKRVAQTIDSNIENIVMRHATASEKLEFILQKVGNVWQRPVDIPNNIEAWIKLGESMKGSLPTDEQLATWQELGNLLAQIQDEELEKAKSIQNSWTAAVGAFEAAKERIKEVTYSLTELAKMPVTLDNYQSLINQVEHARQNEIALAEQATNAQIEALREASEARIAQLEKEKDTIKGLMGIVQSLNLRIYEQANNTDFGFTAEIRKAKRAFETGQDYDISDLQEVTNSYADKILKHSVSREDYIRKMAELREQIQVLRTGLPHGTIEAVENAIIAEKNALKAAIEAQERTLAQKTTEINNSVVSILEGMQAIAEQELAAAAANTQAIVDAIKGMQAAYLEQQKAKWSSEKSRTAFDNMKGWTKNFGPTLSIAELEEIFGKFEDIPSLAYNWFYGGALSSEQWEKVKKASDKREAFIHAFEEAIGGLFAKRVTLPTGETVNAIVDKYDNIIKTMPLHPENYYSEHNEQGFYRRLYERLIDGSHANGLDYVPFDGYIAELHKGERVQTASEVQKDVLIETLAQELSELKAIFIKNTAEMTRMSKILTRLDAGDALSVRIA